MIAQQLIAKSTLSSWDHAELFCRTHDITLLEIDQSSKSDFELVFSYGYVSLFDCRSKKPIELKIDFGSGATDHRRRYGGGAGQAIAKACGVKGGRKLNILDATAGLGGDSFVLAGLGCTLEMIERSPIAYCLLNDALRRARETEDEELASIANRMNLHAGEGKQLLCDSVNWFNGKAPDIIYLDPMFPEKNKKALAKKEMQMFQVLVGDDADSNELLEPALDIALYRVVVKRSKLAPFLNGREPSLQLSGKSSRFDIYTKKKLPDVSHT